MVLRHLLLLLMMIMICSTVPCCIFVPGWQKGIAAACARSDCHNSHSRLRLWWGGCSSCCRPLCELLHAQLQHNYSHMFMVVTCEACAAVSLAA